MILGTTKWTLKGGDPIALGPRDTAVVLRDGGAFEAIIPEWDGENEVPFQIVMATLFVELMQKENEDLADALMERSKKKFEAILAAKQQGSH